MSTDSLHTLVSGAIWRAEQLEEHQESSAPFAWAEVSALEEALATALPASEPEGRIARRGAVRAALKARDHARAHALTQRYLAEREAPESLRAALREMLEEDIRIFFDVFLSYERQDSEFARSLRDQLVAQGIRVWSDKHLVPGTAWISEIEKQVQRSRLVTVLIGREGFGEDQEHEVSAFLELHRPVIPVILPDVEGTPNIPSYLRQFQSVDFRNSGLDPLGRLIRGIMQSQPLSTK